MWLSTMMNKQDSDPYTDIVDKQKNLFGLKKIDMDRT